MKVKKTTIREIAICFLISTVTIIAFFKTNGVGNENLTIALIDALFKSITMVICLNIIEKLNHKYFISGAGVFILVTLLYNQNSIVKFAVDSLYDGCISDNYLRLLGAFIVNVTIIISTLVWYKYHRKNKEFLVSSDKTGVTSLFINPTWVWIIAAVYILLQIYYIVTYKMLFTQSGDRTAYTFYSIYEYITFTVVSINIKKENGKYAKASLIPVAIISLVLLFGTLIIGTKQIIIRFGIVIACSLLFQRKIDFKPIKAFFYVSPILLQGITIVSELVSGRFSGSESYALLRYHVFRYDLSDLAMTISLRHSESTNGFKVLLEAIEFAIPKIFLPGKSNLKSEFSKFMISIGMSGTFDFNDTFFSSGAQIGGLFGMVLIPILVVLLYEYFSKKIISLKKVGPAILITVFGYFSYAESDWCMFTNNTRDALIFVVICYFVFKVFLKRKKKLGANLI